MRKGDISMDVCAGIVLFNPDLERLDECTNSILTQMDEIVLVDNGSANVHAIRDWAASKGERVHFVQNGINCGIAKALNQILEFAAQHARRWFLTLDQDSIASPDLMCHYSKLMDIPHVAQICCAMVDRNGGETEQFGTGGGNWKFVDCCLTSGTLNNTAAVQAAGGFEEAFFIDGVDLDISHTLREHGYKIVKSNHVGLLHQLGQRVTKKVFRKQIVLSNHVPWRNYYARRNLIWVARMHYSGLRKAKAIFHQLALGMGAVAFGNQKVSRLGYNAKGLFDGVFRAPPRKRRTEGGKR